MRPISLSPLTLLPCSQLDQIDAAVDAGFESVGLRILPSLPTDVDVMADTALRREIERRVRDTGLKVLDVEVARLTADMRLGPIEPVLEFAAGLGARWLAATSLELADYSVDDEPELVHRLVELGELSGKYGLGVMLEFMAFRGIANFQDAIRIVDAADSPHVAITLDALHFFRSGGTVADLRHADPKKLACVQLSDGPARPPADLVSESRRDRLYPGEGDLPLASLISALPSSLPVSVEAPSRSRAHLPVAARAHEAAMRTRKLLASIS